MARQEVKLDLGKIHIKPFDGSDFTIWRWQVETYVKAAKLEKVIFGPREGEAEEDSSQAAAERDS